eukprot:4556355-Karenia_brevis.AAC.1
MGYVFGLRDGRLGYHRAVGLNSLAYSQPASVSDPELQYLRVPSLDWLQGDANSGKVTLQLDLLVPDCGGTVPGQAGQKRRTRDRVGRVRKRKRKFCPAEVSQ